MIRTYTENTQVRTRVCSLAWTLRSPRLRCSGVAAAASALPRFCSFSCNCFCSGHSSPLPLLLTHGSAVAQGDRKCQLVDAFAVDGNDAKGFAKMNKIGNRKLLWHGTNVAVVAAILKSGLRIMPHSGGRVGSGVYLASENGKSAGYCTANKYQGVMFLCEAALGKQRVITRDGEIGWHDTDPCSVRRKTPYCLLRSLDSSRTTFLLARVSTAYDVLEI